MTRKWQRHRVLALALAVGSNAGLSLMAGGCGTESAGTARNEDGGTLDDGAGPLPDGGLPDGASADGDTPAPDAAVVIPPGEPIDVAEDLAWEWIPVDGATCRNGSATGIGVNFNSESDKLLIYFMGGNACFDTYSCLSTPQSFGKATFESAATQNVLNSPNKYFSRTNAENPFKDWNYVFIPYCTGDVHGGTRAEGTSVGNQTNRFRGYLNVKLYLARLLGTFDNLEQIVATGESAGGFGVAINYDRIQRSFGDVPVYMIDDSGPPLDSAYLKPCLQERVRSLWGLDAALPEGCTDCTDPTKGGLINLAPHVAAAHPTRRLALISSMQDETIRRFYNFGYKGCNSGALPFWFDSLMPAADYKAGLVELRDEVLAGHDNFKTFYVDPSVNHVIYGANPASVQPAVKDWVRAMVEDDPDWDHMTVAP